MAKLRLGPLMDDKPVKLNVELSGSAYRDLQRYAAALAVETGEADILPERLIAPMVERFMAADRAFAKHRRSGPQPGNR